MPPATAGSTVTGSRCRPRACGRRRRWPTTGPLRPPQAATGTALTLSDRLRAVPALASGDDRAAALIELAQRAWLAGRGQDAAQALPLYIRDKVAQTTAEREAARAAA